MLHFTIEVDIDRPRDEVIELMHPDNMVHWAAGFIAMKHLSGPIWEEGSKYELHFKKGNVTYKVIETFVTRRLPDSFSCIFEEKSSVQISENWLEILSGDKTRWVSKQSLEGLNFFTSILMKCLPWVFKGHVKNSMLDFKDFVEKGHSYK